MGWNSVAKKPAGARVLFSWQLVEVSPSGQWSRQGCVMFASPLYWASLRGALHRGNTHPRSSTKQPRLTCRQFRKWQHLGWGCQVPWNVEFSLCLLLARCIAYLLRYLASGQQRDSFGGHSLDSPVLY